MSAEKNAAAAGTVICHETFEAGPGGWVVGKNWPQRDSPDVWHKNFLGHHGKGLPLAWSADGGPVHGYGTASSPWYFDANHGEFYCVPLVLTLDAPAVEPIAHHDVRGARIDVALRGRELDRKDCRLFFWLQGIGGDEGYYEKPVHRCWALTSVPLEDALDAGGWEHRTFTLPADESRWSNMGLLNGGLIGKIRVIQSLTSGHGSLTQILNGNLYNMGFILCGLNPVDLPHGHIDIGEFKLTLA